MESGGVAGTRGEQEDSLGENVREISHKLTMKMVEADVALFTVTREFRPRRKEKPIWLYRQIRIPSQAVVGSFEIRTGNEWRKARLEESRALPRLPVSEGFPSPGSAPLAFVRLPRGDSRAIGEVDLLVAPWKPKGALGIRYTIWAQAQPHAKGHRWRYCSEGDSVVPIVPPDGLRVFRDPESRDCLVLERPAPPRKEFIARYGIYHLRKHWYWYADLAIPQVLSNAAPKPGPVVFVLDASRSQEDRGGLSSEFAIVRAYLANVPQAEVELVLFNRTAERVLGRFVPAPALERLLPRGLTTRPLRNGSFLEKALGLAADALIEHGTPGRIVVLSDGELRSGFRSQDANALLDRISRPTVVLHVSPWQGDDNAEINRSSSFRHRELDNTLLRFGGASYEVGIGKRDNPRVLQKLMSRLVWPDRIESIQLCASERSCEGRLPAIEPLDPDQVSVADGFGRWSGISLEPPPERLFLEGWIWGQRIRLPLDTATGFQHRIPKLVSAEFEMTLRRPYHEPCQVVGASVDEALAGAFLTRGMEFRVSGDGAVPFHAGESGTVFDPRCAPRSIGKGGRPDSPERSASSAGTGLRGVDGVEQAFATCGLALEPVGDVEVQIETLKQEIVDIAIRGGSDQARECLEQGLWNLSLPRDFNNGRGERQSYVFAASAVR